MTDLIQIKQLPIIEEQLRSMKSYIDQMTSEAMSLACTAETIQSVKDARSALRKKYDEVDAQRKQVKDALMGPYDAFMATYNECVALPFKRADADLKGKIADVEGAIKAECEAEMRDYFSELCGVNHIDWLTWERGGFKIDLTTAKQKNHNKLREAVAEFVTGVSNDQLAIASMENADEIMVEYKKTLSLSGSVAVVYERNRRIQEERERNQEIEAAKAAQEAAVERVEAVLPPVAVVTPPEPKTPEKCFKCSFTVHATKAQLMGLKEYMEKEGIKYE